MPLAQFIPMACLAGVLVIVSYNMSGWRTFKQLMKSPKSDIAVLITTFILTVIFDLTIAIEVGLVIACFLCMRRMSETTNVSVSTDSLKAEDESDMKINQESLTIPEGVEVYEINGPLFFGVATKFEELASMRDAMPIRIVRMRKVSFIDSTGLHNLEIFIDSALKVGQKVILSGVNKRVYNSIVSVGIVAKIGKENVLDNIDLALARAEQLAKELEN